MKSKLSTRPSPSAELRCARSHVVDVAKTSTQFCTRVPPEVLDARRGVKQVFYDSFQANIDLGSCLAASFVANLISPPRSHMRWAIPAPALYFVCSVCGCQVTVSDIRTVFCTPVLTKCARGQPRTYRCVLSRVCRPCPGAGRFGRHECVDAKYHASRSSCWPRQICTVFTTLQRARNESGELGDVTSVSY